MRRLPALLLWGGLCLCLARPAAADAEHDRCIAASDGTNTAWATCGADLLKRDFGSVEAWRTDLKATGMAARGWAWTAYDWDEGRLFNYLGDAQNTYPIWNATPLVALDVYEHAYFLDFQTDRGAYIDAFFANLDWAVVNDWVAKYQIPLK